MQNAENILFTITMVGYFGAMILYFLFVGIRKEQMAKTAGIIQGAALVNELQHRRGSRAGWRFAIPLLLSFTAVLLFAGIFDQIVNVRGLRKPPEPKEEF
jgi:hypothetical protein